MGRLKATEYQIAQDKSAYNAWLELDRESNEKEMEHIRNMLHVAICNELTQKQREYITAYFFDGMKMTQIAELMSVDTSTVSRTIGRAKRKINRVLQYASPRLLNAHIR